MSVREHISREPTPTGSSDEQASSDEMLAALSAALRGALALAQLLGGSNMIVFRQSRCFLAHAYGPAQKRAFFDKQDRRGYVAFDAAGLVDFHSGVTVDGV